LTTVLIPGAFVIVAENSASFGDALVKKLVAEKRPGALAASRQPALARSGKSLMRQPARAFAALSGGAVGRAISVVFP